MNIFNKNIKVKRLTDTAVIPTKGSEYAAGMDLYADGDYRIPSGHTEKISTGIAIEIPHGYFGGIYARSGLATKQGLRPANAVGIVDEDYRGEIIVALHNDNIEHVATPKIINRGDRIAQLVIQPYLNFGFEEVDELDDTDRGEGGFGSTGKN